MGTFRASSRRWSSAAKRTLASFERPARVVSAHTCAVGSLLCHAPYAPRLYIVPCPCLNFHVRSSFQSMGAVVMLNAAELT